jgi:hypothetical protein
MNKIESIHVAPSSERRAAPGRFENALQGAAQGLARGVAATVDVAAPYVPGGMVLSGALHGAMKGGSEVSAVAAATGTTTTAGGTAPSGDGDVLAQTRALQEEARTFNLQYLQLQESLQRESREFTALTNVVERSRVARRARAAAATACMTRARRATTRPASASWTCAGRSSISNLLRCRGSERPGPRRDAPHIGARPRRSTLLDVMATATVGNPQHTRPASGRKAMRPGRVFFVRR